MEVEEIDAVLEKIWDLHDKLSDAIHSISRTHFLRSVKSSLRTNNNSDDTGNRNGFVFVKGFPPVDESAIQEAKSLNAIRTALENLEDQLEFFHVSLFFIAFSFHLIAFSPSFRVFVCTADKRMFNFRAVAWTFIYLYLYACCR